MRATATAAEIAWCLDRIEDLCLPCDPALAAQKLAELRVLTAHRARDGIDVELMAGAYTQRLAQYPADVVVAVCDAWADGDTFWPAWSDLKAACDRRMRGRTQIRDALRSWRPPGVSHETGAT